MKLMRLLTGTLLLVLPAGIAFGQNSVPSQSAKSKVQSVQQQKQAQTVKVSAAKPAAQPVQVKAAAVKPVPVKTTPAKPAVAKMTPAKSVPVKAVSAKPGSAKPVAHVNSMSAKVSASANAESKAKTPAITVAKYPAATPKTASAIHAVSHKQVSKNLKNNSPLKQKVAIEVTKTKTAAPEKTDKTADKSADKEDKVVLTGRRDPFVSPVMLQSATGSGCSTGKRCLAIDQISLKGIVKSENGMIAVVENALDKAYFLHENDPVFDGYVVKITGDSIVFKETVQDKLGKAFTREVTKRISTPAV